MVASWVENTTLRGCVLATDDGVTMTTVDGINIAYFQGPKILKVLFNRQRSICLRPLPPNFNVVRDGRYLFRGSASFKYPLSVWSIYIAYTGPTMHDSMSTRKSGVAGVIESWISWSDISLHIRGHCGCLQMGQRRDANAELASLPSSMLASSASLKLWYSAGLVLCHSSLTASYSSQ